MMQDNNVGAQILNTTESMTDDGRHYVYHDIMEYLEEMLRKVL